MIPIPPAQRGQIPTIQHVFPQESDEARRLRISRLDAVRSNFTHAWQGYKKYAWMYDEVGPLSGQAYNHFGGWAATLVDSLGLFLS
jgi:mannosyl-oligosaccharide alpha-1,2-mannosidase